MGAIKIETAGRTHYRRTVSPPVNGQAHTLLLPYRKRTYWIEKTEKEGKVLRWPSLAKIQSGWISLVIKQGLIDRYTVDNPLKINTYKPTTWQYIHLSKKLTHRIVAWNIQLFICIASTFLSWFPSKIDSIPVNEGTWGSINFYGSLDSVVKMRLQVAGAKRMARPCNHCSTSSLVISWSKWLPKGGKRWRREFRSSTESDLL